MKQTKKIYVCYGSKHDMSWIENAEYEVNPLKADALLLTGGGDIHPSFYGGMQGVPFTWDKSSIPGERCNYESKAIDRAIELNIPIIGICRGLQWICVKAGGILVQDVKGHSHRSKILAEGKLYKANSLHHQMIYPFNLPKDDVQIIGIIAKPEGYDYIVNGKVIDSIPAEIEIAYFPKIKGFGVQFHPEVMTNYLRNNRYSFIEDDDPISTYKDGESQTLDYLNELLYRTIWA